MPAMYMYVFDKAPYHGLCFGVFFKIFTVRIGSFWSTGVKGLKTGIQMSVL